MTSGHLVHNAMNNYQEAPVTAQIPVPAIHAPSIRRFCRRLELPSGTSPEELVGDGSTLFAYSSSVSGRSLYASGSALSVALNGPDTHTRLHQACSRVTEHLEGPDDRPDTIPLWVGSLACLPGRPRVEPGVWGDWPDARFWIPRVLILAGGPGQRWLILATGDDPAAAEAAPAAFQSPAVLPTTRASYEAAVSTAVRAISDNTSLCKVVVARAARFSLAGAPTLASLLGSARAAEPSATHIIVRWPGAGTFLSSTPERLVALDGRHVSTEALAGTTRRGPGQLEALLASAKDRHEHAVVVDGIVSSLSPLCDDLSVPAAPDARTLASLLHLRTPIRGTLRRRSHILALAARLHPTAAIVGSPAGEAKRWLADHEAMDRGHYAGPAGWFDGAGNGELSVALRSALIRHGQAWAFAGAGIVEGSDPAAEWHETEAKLSTAKTALADRGEA